jgi:NhaA family Na+:H+ antiporter
MPEPHPRPDRTRPVSAIRDFLAKETAGGLILMGAAALAILVANSPLAADYFRIRDAYLGPLSVLHWINDLLMALFFLFVGLEIKRELVDGELSTWERRTLPGVAALAGMALPALIYVAINRDDPAALRGWAIPGATDIAFALGVLALLGKRVPASLKVFLTAVAVLDDMGAVTIIALFYTVKLNLLALGAAAAILGALTLINWRGVRALWPYLLAAPLLWLAVFQSGVHATIAGVALAMVIPLKAGVGIREEGHSPLHRLEHALAPWAAFVIVPIFGFANAGVSLAGLSAETAFAGVPLGIAAGLVFGKQIGVFGAVWALCSLRLADVPAEATLRQVWGVALLAGIGFTMSLFIGELAFRDSAEVMDQVKIGVLAGSVLSALAGAAVLLGARPQVRAAPPAAAIARAAPTP